MLKEERLNYIVNEVKIRNRVQLVDIAQKLAVSEDTVRRDLNYLDEQGKVKKVHGGAISNSFHVYTYREDQIYAYESKSVIAAKAISQLKEGDVVVMSGGTTNLEAARLIRNDLKITVFTPSLPIAMQLLVHKSIEVIFVGGKLSHDAQIAVGGDAIRTLQQVKADVCLMGTGNLDVNHGLTEFDWDVVQLKKVMIESAKRVMVLTISEKINSSQRFNVCPVTSIHTLITELPQDANALQDFKEKGLQIL
ncbi:MAG: DeoR/GlpR transcriptional regulator [Chryseotalea sp. WA131a]|jgi:DeoR/GlpR family transcriptional regulator of sugar metabolism|nr:MAG: DeoR/GlpR transcriptional regulator [Chryseotalea sp. WA131a]